MISYRPIKTCFQLTHRAVAAIVLGTLLHGTVHAQALGDCAAETGIADRDDIVFCEGWEDANWWQNGYLKDPRKVNPIPADASTMSSSEIVTDNCISGSCLKVNMPLRQTGSLGVHWPLAEANLEPQELYLRYYIKLGPSFEPNQCYANGTWAGDGGKFPGLADTRTAEQCGNGGNTADGLNCWSMRADFRSCYSGDNNACSTKPGATTRFGSYLYHYDQTGATGSHGFWDGDDWGQSGYTCNDPNDVFCGIGDGGVFVNNEWYLVEMFVKMNTPDQPNGVIRGWVDGVLSYEKDNMIWRLNGHDNLHVRTVWLNVYKGGVEGNCVGSEIYLDQMVVATNGVVGGFAQNVIRPNPPAILNAN